MSVTGETTNPNPGEDGRVRFGFASALGAIPKVFGRTWRGLVWSDLAFKAFGAILTLGFMGVVLSEVASQTGHSAVTNADIATFLAHPTGLLLAFIAGAGTVFLVMVEQAVLMCVAAILYYHPDITPWELVKTAGAAIHRIARLAGLLVLISLAISIPPVAIIGILYKLFLGGHDINFYLSSKPPSFLAVAGVAAALLLSAAALLAAFYTRAVLTVPIVLFERKAPFTSIRESFTRTSGTGWRVAAVLVVWHGSWLIVTWLCLSGLRHLIGMGFGAVDSTSGAVVSSAAALVALSVAATALSFGSWAGHALLVMRLYVLLHPEGERPDPLPEHGASRERETSLATRAALVAFLLLAAVTAVSFILARRVSQLGHTQITAHRGYSRVAPENTLSAVRKAIEAGADWAEIDVQETADGVVVVTHDRDLMRIAGDPRRLTEITFEELSAIDAGSKFGPEFAGERVPSLEEVFALARGRIKLNIELKYYGDDPRLARDVARLIKKNSFERECFVASLDFPKLIEAKRENPELRTGAIVTVDVGDITKLDADVLSVNAGLMNFMFLRKARLAKKEVHVWTVDDGRVAKVLMGRGVANIITNDPELIVRERAAWEKLSVAEKLLLAMRYLMGLSEKKEIEGVKSQGEL